MNSDTRTIDNGPVLPAGSNLSVQREDGGTLIVIPPRGSGCTILAALLVGSFFGVISSALLALPFFVDETDTLLTFTCIPFGLITGLAAMVLFYAFAILLDEATRSTKLAVRDGSLSVGQRSVVSLRQESWPAKSIHSLSLRARDKSGLLIHDLDAFENMQRHDGVHFFLETRTQNGRFLRLAEGRSPDELTWLVEQLRQGLALLPGQLNPAPRPYRTRVRRVAEQEASIQGAVCCSACESVYRIDEQHVSCQNCGAALILPEEKGLGKRRRNIGATHRRDKFRTALQDDHGKHQNWFDVSRSSLKQQVEGGIACVWCEQTHEQRPASPNCPSCGGVLPLPPSTEPGPQPPATPRDVPIRFRLRSYFKHRPSGWIAVALCGYALALFWVDWRLAVATLALSLFSGKWAFGEPHRRMVALRHGRAILGRIESVHTERSYDRRARYRVYYRFNLDDDPVRDVRWTADPKISNHFVGEPAWVVYDDRQPCSDLWPPLV